MNDNFIKQTLFDWQWKKCINFEQKSLPYSSDISKNKKFEYRTSKVKSVKYARYQRLVAMTFKQFCKQLTKNKVWIFISVYRPDMRSDPTNFIEGILDGIRIVCPNVDDNYFSTICDWHMDKEKPRFEITIIQQRKEV